MKYFMTIVVFYFSLSCTLHASEFLLFAKFDNPKDAKDSVVLFKKIIQKTGIKCGFKIVKNQNMYSVLSRREVTAVEKKEITKSIDLYLHGDDAENVPSKKNRLSGSVETGIGYANNIYAHTELETTKYGNQNIDNNTSQVSDSFSLSTASLRHSYTFDNHGWMWRSAANLYNKKYKDHNDVDIFQIALQSGPAYKFDHVVIGTSVIGKKLWFGGDLLMDTYGLLFDLSYKASTDKVFGIKLLALEKRMSENIDRGYDNNHLELEMKYGMYHNSRLSFMTSVAMVMERRVHGARTDINYNAVVLSGKYSFPLWEGVDMSTKVRAEFRNYIDKHIHLPKREDTKMQVEVTIQQKLTDTFSPRIRYSHTENYSNINLYRYKDDKIVVGLRAKF